MDAIDTARLNAAEVVDAFNAKVREVATANGWTEGRAAAVMLAYLRDTDPETAKIAAASLLLAA